MVNQKRFLNREINNKLINIQLVRLKMYLTAINNFIVQHLLRQDICYICL